ncbi:MAG: hypothetical protein CME59_13910 [Halioglobus sp.]|nr:hypothetical protein [Halioglobus sp.]
MGLPACRAPRFSLLLAILCLSLLLGCSDGSDRRVEDSPEIPPAPTAFQLVQQAVLDDAVAVGRGGTYGALLHIAAGLAPREGSFDEDLEQLNNRDDTADFALPGFLTLLARYADSNVLDSEQRQRIEDAIINFKYWPDELQDVPGTSDSQTMVTWTENHYILFTSGAYIAGQLYPERVFPASGRTGAQQMAVYRERILRWLELRYASGFSEWLSNVYYNADIPALLALIELAEDDELVQKSRMVLDLILADMALNNFGGNFGATHGRTYTHKMNGNRDSARGIMHMAFGLHRLHSGTMSTAMLALSENYRVPQVLSLIANDAGVAPLENRQRMGIKLEEAASWGLDIDSLDDGMLFMTMEPYTHPLFIDTFYAMLNAYQWWGLRDFSPFKEYRAFLDDPEVRAAAVATYEWDITRNMRPEVNIYTYRTPDYMLSTAQDWRKGYGGDQSSIWQATLGMEAVAFTTHPANEEDADSSSPNYWVGYGTLPRAAQVKNVVITLYDVDTRDGLYYSNQPLYSHAFLPRARFDESLKQGQWFFARKDDAYLALWSSDPDADWIPAVEQGFGGGGDYDIIAAGEKTVWICELGDAGAYGDFEAFRTAILAAPLVADADSLEVRYESPSQGAIEMGWEGPVLHNGVALALDNYPRYDNAWSQSGFPADVISFSYGDSYLRLDFDTLTREASSYLE